MGSISYENGSCNNKPHAVCVTYPAQGHVNPMMHFAKLLHSRGFFITFINSEFNHNRLIKSNGGSSGWADRGAFPDFQFETMQDGLPPSDRDATQDPTVLCCSLRRNCLPAFRKVLERLRVAAEGGGVPPVSLVVVDGVMSCAAEAAREIGVPEVRFWSASACGFLGYLQYPELLRRGIIPFKDNNYENDGTLDMPVDWIPNMKNIRLKDLPSHMRITNVDDIVFNFLKDAVQDCLKSPAIIFNTFDALEHKVLDTIKSIFPNKIYTIGPIALMEKKHVPESPIKSFRPSLWKDEKQCLEWLGHRRPKSVVFVSYGCMTVMTKEHLVELAWGLANSKHPFLWVLRPDVVVGDQSGSSFSLLPNEFLVETRGRGLIVTWCPQDEVLSHPSVGVFMTHCGWNSVQEGVCEGGVPVICWPSFAEQQMNCRYACGEGEWGVGVEVKHEVKRGEVECLVREMMDGKKGMVRRRRALEWKMKAEEATNVGGSSYANFDQWIRMTHNGTVVTSDRLL